MRVPHARPGRQFRSVLVNVGRQVSHDGQHRRLRIPSENWQRKDNKNENDNGWDIEKFNGKRWQEREGEERGAEERAEEDNAAAAAAAAAATAPHRPPEWNRFARAARTDQLRDAIEYRFSRCRPIQVINSNNYNNTAMSMSRSGSGSRAIQKTISIQSILCKYIREADGAIEGVDNGGEASYTPTPAEVKFLGKKGFTPDDVIAWSDIILATTSDKVARLFAKRVKSRKEDPLFIILHSLHRKHISARALRTTIVSLSDLLKNSAAARRRSENVALLIVVVRLLRHSREVWPQSLPAIVALFLAVLKRQDATRAPAAPLHRRATNFALNKIMSLVSLSTAVLPFKNIVFQEMAILAVLRHMDAHDPPLHINRSGYRAVVRIQLAQRKTPHEQQWAELKALSWPPWKVDRTAMDASVTLEHGTSNARATLIRMRHAGYRFLAWERAAEVYSGWNPDGTPTIQRRVMMGSPRWTNPDSSNVSEPPKSSTLIPWAARISSTRTIQEAWACYLAWEDANLPPDQSVYLNIVQKLHEEAQEFTSQEQQQQQQGHQRLRRRQQQQQKVKNPAWDLFPGDTPQVYPLPPSAHLYTYTRTAPPTVQEFYNRLRAQGVKLTGHTLAFMIHKAPSLKVGLDCIKRSRAQYPDLQVMLTLEKNPRAFDVQRLPQEIFAACVGLFAASGGYFLDAWEFRTPALFPRQHHDHGDPNASVLPRVLDRNLVILRAMDLLRLRPSCGRQTWVMVFNGLARESHFPRFGQAVLMDKRRRFGVIANKLDNAAELGWWGALAGYELLREVVKWYRREYEDLDPVGFYRLATALDAMVRGLRRLDGMLRLQGSNSNNNHSGNFAGRGRGVLERCRQWVESGTATRELREEFLLLVGGNHRGCDSRNENDERDEREEEALVCFGGEARIPRLLHVPNPAMLHAYTRALGFAEDFEGLRDLALWMREYRVELQERRERDRAGRDMFRRVLVALRVFTERSWKVDVPHLGEKTPPDEFLRNFREILEESLGDDEKWPTEEEVRIYCQDGKFDGLR